MTVINGKGVSIVPGDCIEQLARDVGNYLYDLVKGDKDNG